MHIMDREQITDERNIQNNLASEEKLYTKEEGDSELWETRDPSNSVNLICPPSQNPP